MEDLSALLSRPTIQSFELDGVPHRLNELDIQSLLNSWPTLHTLAITNDKSVQLPASVLLMIAQSSYLRCVKLPLDLSYLKDAPAGEAAVSYSLRLQTLVITSINSELDKKAEIARNLFDLFPMLEISTDSRYQSDKEYVGEIEKLIGMFRDVIVTYLRRSELVERTTKSRGVVSEAVQSSEETMEGVEDLFESWSV
jgi:hypothetical protein